MKSKKADFYLGVSTLVNLVTLGFLLGHIIVRYPVNHVGFNPWKVGLVLVPTVRVIFLPWFAKTWRRFVPAAVWLTLLVGVLCVNFFNILVQHSTWGARGLPEWGEFKIQAAAQLNQTR